MKPMTGEPTDPFPGLRDLSADQARDALAALFKSAESYVVYRLRKVPIDVNPLGGEVEVVSPSIRDVMGVPSPEDLGSWFARVHPDDLDRVMRAQLDCYGRDVPFDEQFRMTLDQGVRWIHAVSHPVFDERGEVTHYNGLVIDVTEHRAAQEEADQLRRTVETLQRTHALGTLAASVAHDFNNLLQAVATLSAIARAAPPGEATSMLGEIEEAVARGASLTRDLLDIAGSADTDDDVVDVSPALERVARIIGRLFVGITVELGPMPARPRARFAAGELEQVLLNLAINAAHATDSRGTIALRARELTGEEAAALLGISARAPVIAVEVADDGEGISNEALERIFEPYFTTKPVGSGTGLGLATVKRLVERRGGAVHVSSTVGEGSVFTIVIPRADEAVAPRPRARALAPATGRILLVDDDATLRRGLERYLVRVGHEVASASSYAEALALWEHDRDTFRLLLTDTVLPGRGGLELAHRLRAQVPELPVIVISGVGEDPSVRELLATPRTAFLPKPFAMAELDSTITRLSA